MDIKCKQIRIDKEIAYRLIDCRKDSPLYDEMEVLYDEIWHEMKNLIKPWGRVGFASHFQLFGNQGEMEYAMVLYTLGAEVSSYIDSLFEKDEYLKAMLADAMADSCLFAMEEEWKPVLKKACEKRKCGITKRMEAPIDFPVESYKKIWSLLDGADSDVTLTSGYMFSPVKTCCFLFGLSQKCQHYYMDHDCKSCPNMTCLLRG